MEANLHVRLPDENERDQTDQLLVGKFAYMMEPPNSQRWTFYDTYDRRIFNRSLVLRQAGQELALEHLADGKSVAGPLTG